MRHGSTIELAGVFLFILLLSVLAAPFAVALIVFLPWLYRRVVERGTSLERLA